MVIRNVSLETVCGITSKIPDNLLPEVAFAGKSNVGKSSLINALMNRKSLARTSSQPGKTQTINFYNINNEIYFVDLPGYGYTRANEEVKAKWGKMVENYLHRSRRLKAVFLLIDIRHAPGSNDCIMYDWIKKTGVSAYHYRYQTGQDKTQPVDKAGKSDKKYPEGRRRHNCNSFFSGEQTGKGRNLHGIGQVFRTVLKEVFYE